MSMNKRTVAAILLATLLVLAASIGFLVGRWESRSAQPATAAVEDSFPPCRENPMAHVYRPTRLTVVSECVIASGTVERVDFVLLDGNYSILVEPDPQYAQLLAPSNKGMLAVEVTAADRPSVYIPVVGQHATFHGALVVDKSQNKRVEIHPAWLITTLDVTVDDPRDVPVGQSARILIEVRSIDRGTSRPASEADLFLELISLRGEAVRWEVGRTNTLGKATFNLATLEVAGNYTLRVYASKSTGSGTESGIAGATFKIKRR